MGFGVADIIVVVGWVLILGSAALLLWLSWSISHAVLGFFGISDPLAAVVALFLFFALVEYFRHELVASR